MVYFDVGVMAQPKQMTWILSSLGWRATAGVVLWAIFSSRALDGGSCHFWIEHGSTVLFVSRDKLVTCTAKPGQC